MKNKKRLIIGISLIIIGAVGISLFIINSVIKQNVYKTALKHGANYEMLDKLTAPELVKNNRSTPTSYYFELPKKGDVQAVIFFKYDCPDCHACFPEFKTIEEELDALTVAVYKKTKDSANNPLWEVDRSDTISEFTNLKFVPSISIYYWDNDKLQCETFKIYKEENEKTVFDNETYKKVKDRYLDIINK